MSTMSWSQTAAVGGHYCEGGFHDEPRFSFLNFNRLVESLQNFEYEYNYKKRS